MTVQPFANYLFQKFREWEELQPKRRSSFSEFARWLSDNSLGWKVSQQIVNSWMNGKIPKEDKYVLILAEKIGDEIYDVLQLPHPDRNIIYVQTQAANLTAEEAKAVRDIVKKYVTKRAK